MHTQDIESFLIKDGWEYIEDPFEKESKPYYKFFDTPTKCKHNHDKPGVKICIKLCGNIYQMHLGGQLQDGTWIKLFHWVIPLNLEEGLQLIPRLLATWEFVANYKES
jgi:hypothetical protein